eukprot:scaffold427198_cov47-Prasinocladus_malaysianus.AAC.1
MDNSASQNALQPSTSVSLDQLRQLIISTVANLVGTAPRADEPMILAGIDSLGAVELRTSIMQELGIDLPATVIFDHPTALELSGHIYEKLEALVSLPSNHSEPALQAQMLRTQSAGCHQPCAIVSMGHRLPQGVTCLPFQADGDQSCVVPCTRWDVDGPIYADLTPSGRHAVLLSAGLGLFDPELFGISVAEAVYQDPQQRLLLEVAAESHACNHLDAEAGVFLGIWAPDYNSDVANKLSSSVGDSSPFQATGSVMSVAAGRLSFTFGLKGACISIDTACSASLVATHLACASLWSAEGIEALAAGANLIVGPGKSFSLVAASMLSPGGRCQPLSAGADGYARGEGVLTLTISSMKGVAGAAVAVLGSAINQDGRSSSLTAPHGRSQQEVIGLACRSTGIKLADLRNCMMHGTGTALGDPIEVGALLLASGSLLRLQACKSMLGHSEAAAGLASLVSAVSFHKHQHLLGVRHLRHVNPHVCSLLEQPGGTSHLCLQAARQHTPFADTTSMMGSSSFAYQGTNCHIITDGIDDAILPCAGAAQ